jgi:Na+-translocating ferredoxin:NAD+ oxidoreductase RNF subunit RnfB
MYKSYSIRCKNKKCLKYWKGTWDTSDKYRVCIHCGKEFEVGKVITEELEVEVLNNSNLTEVSETEQDPPKKTGKRRVIKVSDEVKVPQTSTIEAEPVKATVKKVKKDKGAKYGRDPETGQALKKDGTIRKPRSDKGKNRK